MDENFERSVMSVARRTWYIRRSTHQIIESAMPATIDKLGWDGTMEQLGEGTVYCKSSCYVDIFLVSRQKINAWHAHQHLCHYSILYSVMRDTLKK